MQVPPPPRGLICSAGYRDLISKGAPLFPLCMDRLVWLHRGVFRLWYQGGVVCSHRAPEIHCELNNTILIPRRMHSCVWHVYNTQQLSKTRFVSVMDAL